jgi:redox-sensitive bicupin YhaK (pirin superfamily)
MPAVQVENILALDKVETTVEEILGSRVVVSRTVAPKGFEGEGFPVRRAFAGVSPEQLDPFVHMDQMGEVHYAPGEPKGTPWHPHRGFETVTYIIDGTFDHRDSHGGGGRITNGATQWMTAGSGLLHIEVPPEELILSGGLFHGLQLWVNLPSAQKWIAPHYQSIEPSAVKLLASDDGGSLIRLIAGTVGKHEGPGSTRTPINFVHASIAPGSRLHLPWPREFNGLVYVLGGRGLVGHNQVELNSGELAVLGSGRSIEVVGGEMVDARTETLEVVLLGGRPIKEPVAWYGPFVMNTQAELAQAFEDYRAGKLGSIPAL